ncbi:hypothetical protein PF008_g18019 [Phytophthora fragariae]|uniref:Uncharacterized protein n=1 Tax=Phytophthora fragariae TaxID=53985 RepID=A0A6G0R7V4_9STRA|nr:hypothetical protein PF008_g18019 [Phytophthora fragariae]
MKEDRLALTIGAQIGGDTIAILGALVQFSGGLLQLLLGVRGPIRYAIALLMSTIRLALKAACAATQLILKIGHLGFLNLHLVSKLSQCGI